MPGVQIKLMRRILNLYGGECMIIKVWGQDPCSSSASAASFSILNAIFIAASTDL